MLLERLDLENTHYEAKLLHHLATVHNQQGTHDEAIAMMLRTLEIITGEYGEDHPLLASPLNNLGITYGMQGRLTEAAEVLERAEQLGRAHNGADHPGRAAALNNLGSVYIMLGRNDDAQAALKEARRIYVRLHGPRHPDVAMTEVQLADLLAVRDRAGAVARLDAANESFIAAFGEDHEHHAASRLRLAGLLLELGELPRAESEARRAAEITARVFGTGHIETIRARAVLARVVAARGDHASAQASLARAQEALVSTDADPQHSLHGLVRLWRAEVAEQAGDLETARAMGDEALARLEGTEVSPGDRAHARALAARVASDQDRAKARALMQEALTTYRSLGGVFSESAQDAVRWLDEHPGS